MSHRSYIFLIAAFAVLGVATDAQAQGCASGETLFMALEPMQGLLGFKGETRQQYLDRVYPGWQQEGEQFAHREAAASEEALRVSLAAPAGLVPERVDVIVESKFDYVDRDGQRGERVGHRELARYPLAADAMTQIAVPRSALRESGAVMLALTGQRGEGRAVFVAALPVEMDSCPRRVYTHDRFSAIRLNRGKAAAPAK